MKLKPSSIIERGDTDNNISSNGRAILSPMPHGNRNMHFRMMVTCWNDINKDITCNSCYLALRTCCKSPMTSPLFYYLWHEQNSLIEDLFAQLDDILAELSYIRLAILLDDSPHPSGEFDPFLTIGKYD